MVAMVSSASLLVWRPRTAELLCAEPTPPSSSFGAKPSAGAVEDPRYADAPDHVPQPLVDQLAKGGRLVIPVGQFFQELLVIEKQEDGTIRRKSIAPVMFVPMRGEVEKVRNK
jgi:hypothetical protein